MFVPDNLGFVEAELGYMGEKKTRYGPKVKLEFYPEGSEEPIEIWRKPGDQQLRLLEVGTSYKLAQNAAKKWQIHDTTKYDRAPEQKVLKLATVKTPAQDWRAEEYTRKATAAAQKFSICWQVAEDQFDLDDEITIQKIATTLFINLK